MGLPDTDSMRFLSLALGRLHLVSPFEYVGRRVLYLALLLLPGSIIALPLLWWLDRRRSSPGGERARSRVVEIHLPGTSLSGGIPAAQLRRSNHAIPVDDLPR